MTISEPNLGILLLTADFFLIDALIYKYSSFHYTVSESLLPEKF